MHLKHHDVNLHNDSFLLNFGLLNCCIILFPKRTTNCNSINDQVDNRVNGYLFPKENIGALSQILLQVISKGKLSPLAHSIASIGRGTAKSLMVSETVEGYATLLKNVLMLPSEVAPPRDVVKIPPKLKERWQWHLFEAVSNSTYLDRNLRSNAFLDDFEEQYNRTQEERLNATSATNYSFIYSLWEEEKYIQMVSTKRRREEEMVRAVVCSKFFFPLIVLNRFTGLLLFAFGALPIYI